MKEKKDRVDDALHATVLLLKKVSFQVVVLLISVRLKPWSKS
jgi:hypothetical protein